MKFETLIRNRFMMDRNNVSRVAHEAEPSLYPEMIAWTMSSKRSGGKTGSINTGFNPNSYGIWDCYNPGASERLEWILDDTRNSYQEPGDYLQRLFDDTDYHDGVGFWALGPHQSNMSGLDRMISEQCYAGYHVSDARLLMNDGLRRELRAEWVARAAGFKTTPEVMGMFQNIIEAWKTMEATPKMIRQFIRWFKPAAKWEKASERAGSWMITEREDRLINGFVFFRDLAGQLESVSNWDPIGEPFLDPDDYAQDEWFDILDVKKDEIEEREYNIPSPFRWIPIGFDGFRKEDRWLTKQNERVQEAVIMIRSVKTPKQLSEMGKELFRQKNQFSRVQMGVLWTEYNVMKKKLTNRMSRVFNNLMDMIIYDERPTWMIGRELMKRINQSALLYDQRSELWSMYKSRKARADWVTAVIQEQLNEE